MNDLGPTLTAGMVAPDRVFLCENHDEAYTVWRDLGVRNRILVHIDALHRRRRWAEAEACFRETLAADPRNADACRGLGRALAKQGRNAEAIQAYERSLTLTLAGSRSVLDTLILTNPAEGFVSDPLHAQVHARLGDLYAANGDTSTAISAYRMGIAMGEETLALRFRLAGLYLRRKEWGKCAGQVKLALRRLPSEPARVVRRLRRRLSRRISAGWRAIARRFAPKPDPSLWC